MAAAGAETVSNGGCGPDDRLYLEGNPLEDRPKLEKFIDRFKEAGMVSTCLVLFGNHQTQDSTYLKPSTNQDSKSCCHDL